MTVLNVDTVYGKDIFSFEGVVTEKHHKSLNKDYNPCRDYRDGQKGYITCSKNFLVKYLKNKINCTIPGIKFIYLNNNCHSLCPGFPMDDRDRHDPKIVGLLRITSE